MAAISEKQIMEALRRVIDPEIQRNIVDLNMVRDLKVEGGKVSFTLALTIPECPLRDQLAQDARSAIQGLPGVQSVEVSLGAMSQEERDALLHPAKTKPALAVNNRIARVIAVMSGKGGVGKSLVTGLLATSLARAGHRVGILDADVTGPSIPKLFGVHGPLLGGEQGIEPIQSRLGIKIVSINLALENEEQAVIWRGPLITKTIQQFWNDVNWGQLDELLVDLPPGTSDAALTVMQSLPISGVLMVTTPQALAGMVVKKAVRMAASLNAPVIGIVENMAGFRAEDTGRHYDIFGPSHSEEVAKLAGAPLLARIPLRPELAILCDAGMIETAEEPNMNAVVKAVEMMTLETVTPDVKG
jgi:Mrp family chromosome partitioning ATPase